MSDTYYSINEEDYNFISIDEAIESYCDDNLCVPGDVIEIWEGDSIKHKASHYVPQIIDQTQEIAFDDAGEWAESWLDDAEMQVDLQKAVEVAVDKWADENDQQPKFFTIENPKRLELLITGYNDGMGGFPYKLK